MPWSLRGAVMCPRVNPWIGPRTAVPTFHCHSPCQGAWHCPFKFLSFWNGVFSKADRKQQLRATVRASQNISKHPASWQTLTNQRNQCPDVPSTFNSFDPQIPPKAWSVSDLERSRSPWPKHWNIDRESVREYLPPLYMTERAFWLRKAFHLKNLKKG